MSRALGLLMLLGVGGAGVLVMRQREAEAAEEYRLFRAAQEEAERDAWIFGNDTGGGGGGFDWGPLINMGLSGIMNNTNRTSTGRGLGGLLGGIFGPRGGSGKGAATTPGAGGAVVPKGGAPAPRGSSGAGRPSRRAGRGSTRGLRDLIGSVEAPQGYGQVFGGIPRAERPRDLPAMTVGEVLDWQEQVVRNGSPSSAAGKYQIIRPTLAGLVAEGHVSLNDRFDWRTQDRLADQLLERRGLSDFLSGRIDETTFGQRLAQEWASFPVFTEDQRGRPARGQSYYAGDGLNRSHLTVDQVTRALRDLF
ncbi:MAG: hypothetical protein JJ938_17600 [Roseicyclus sp.]|nr:hypothetical protein [Roseicyclus sp.]MBO6626692.1 hypothetical protein [Roseicyclus sp.]MBO6922356.1 hypothetical protein [Roseicyclus sp.]